MVVVVVRVPGPLPGHTSSDIWRGRLSVKAAEVRNPGRSYPRAMAIAVMLVIGTAALPLLVGIGATNFSDSEWVDGFYAQVGTAIVGNWLGIWIVAGRYELKIRHTHPTTRHKRHHTRTRTYFTCVTPWCIRNSLLSTH